MPRFSEYVGESLEELKKITRQKKEPITETIISFSIGKVHLKRTFDYIKSWLVRYKIPYESVNPYLTLFKVIGVKDKYKLMNEIKDLKSYPYFEDGEVSVLRDGNRDYISVIFSPHDELMKPLREIFFNKSIGIMNESAYVKLISIEKDVFPENLWYEMLYSMPNIPNIKPGSVGLLSRRR